MTDLDSSVWTLAAGAGSVFALSVVLKDQPWPMGFGAVLVAVALWSLRARVLEAVALGGIGWLLVTGFDVNGSGELHFTGWPDAGRGAVLVGVALAAVLAGGLGDWMIGAAGQNHGGPPNAAGRPLDGDAEMWREVVPAEQVRSVAPRDRGAS